VLAGFIVENDPPTLTLSHVDFLMKMSNLAKELSRHISSIPIAFS